MQKAGLYAHLRIGPYVCAEWNFGYPSRLPSSYSVNFNEVILVMSYIFCEMSRGFPVWLKYVPGISFRTDNEPFKVIKFLPS